MIQLTTDDTPRRSRASIARRISARASAVSQGAELRGHGAGAARLVPECCLFDDEHEAAARLVDDAAALDAPRASPP